MSPRRAFRFVSIITTAILSFGTPSLAANVAIIEDDFDPVAENWCIYIRDNGHTCTVFPGSGPDSSLSPFDVVFDLSDVWTDPDGLLSDHLRAGKGVITRSSVPVALGIDTNSTVQAWIGANLFWNGSDNLITSTTDPILGDLPVGTILTSCNDSACTALLDTSGHPHVKVLALFEIPSTAIGVLRNQWEGGQSVYFSNSGLSREMLLRTIDILSTSIPTVSQWGLVSMTLMILISGTIIVRFL